jgi:hypothetical protein
MRSNSCHSHQIAGWLAASVLLVFALARSQTAPGKGLEARPGFVCFHLEERRFHHADSHLGEQTVDVLISLRGLRLLP